LTFEADTYGNNATQNETAKEAYLDKSDAEGGNKSKKCGLNERTGKGQVSFGVESARIFSGHN